MALGDIFIHFIYIKHIMKCKTKHENTIQCKVNKILNSLHYEMIICQHLAVKSIHLYSYKKVQVGKDQEKAQSERDSHSKNQGGKNQTNNQALIP